MRYSTQKTIKKQLQIGKSYWGRVAFMMEMSLNKFKFNLHIILYDLFLLNLKSNLCSLKKILILRPLKIPK